MDSRLKLLLNGDPEEVLMLLIRLKKPEVIVPFCQVITQFGDVITSRVQRKYLLDVYNSPDTLSVKAPRLIPAPLHTENIELASYSINVSSPSRRLQNTYTGKGVYFAAVDWGFDFAHSNLRNPDGSTRFKCIWDQNGLYDNNIYGYGCFHSQDDINRALQTDTPYQTLGYHPGIADILGTGMHGTHVVDIATGTPIIGEGGVAPDATLIGVELGNNFVNGSDLALGDSVRLVEALYFISKAARDAPCVINMSLGSHGDSHTGKSLVEIALDNFLLKNPGFASVQSVGNYYLSNCHIQHTLSQGETYNIEWLIPRRNPTPNEVEIWYPGADEFSIKLIAPDDQIVADVEPFKDIEISYQATPVGYIFQRSNEPNTCLNHVDIILDVSTLKGKWIIQVTGTKISNGFFHAYSERNDAGQAKFSKYQSSPFTTTGSVCNSKHTITAGAYDHNDTLKPVVSFSSSGPTVLGQLKPDLLAPGYKILAARSAPPDAANAINQQTVKSGSSMAAPHVSGLIALLFQKHLPERLGITKIKELLFNSLDPLRGHFSNADCIRSGRGYLNINNLLKESNNMNANYITRPIRRSKDEIEVEDLPIEEEDLPLEQEYHAPYLHENCQQCEQALLETISEGTWASEPQLLTTLNDKYFHTVNLDPFALYRHFHPRYQFRYNPYENHFVTIALPGKSLNSNIRLGDIVLMRNIISGKTHQSIITDPDLFTLGDVGEYPANSRKNGYYIQAYGNGTGNDNKNVYFRIADENNHVLDNVIMLRGKSDPWHSDDYSEASAIRSNADNSFRKPPSGDGNRESESVHDDVKGRIKWFNESRFGKERGPSNQQLVAYSDASENIQILKQGAQQESGEEDFSEQDPVVRKNNWVPLGPSVIRHGQASTNPEVSGRIISIAVGPSGHRVYAGTANGGVWFSGNEGNNWEPLDEFATSSSVASIEADSLSIGSIAVKFGNNRKEDIIYVGTGEPLAESGHWSTQAISAINYFGVGIKYSKDGGAHWKLEGKNLRGIAIYKIAIDPSDADKAFAATSAGIFKRTVSRSGVQWDKIKAAKFTDSNPNAETVVTDLIITGTGANTKYYVAFFNSNVYQGSKLVDGSVSWSPIGGYAYTGRKALAASESNPNIVYVFDNSNTLLRLDASIAGASFQQVASASLPNVFNGGSGWYALILAVDPLDENTVYIGGDWVYDGPPPIHSNAELYTLSLFRGKIKTSGGTFTFPFNSVNAANPAADATYIGTGIHADGHVIAFALDATGTKLDASKLWIGCDGGLFFSNKADQANNKVKGTFNAKNNGLAITQMTYLAQHPDIPSILFCGCQDNGTLRYIEDSKWQRGEGFGDGGGIAIDPNNTLNLISQSYDNGYFKNTDGGLSKWQQIPISVFPITPNGQEQKDTRFYSPMDSFYDSTAKNTMIVLGTTRLWLCLATNKTNWGTAWKSLPSNTDPYLTSPPSSSDYLGGAITSIKIVSASKIYVTTEDDVFRYEFKTGAWSITRLHNIGFTRGKYFITSIAVDPNYDCNFYIALGGPGNFVRCYYFTDTGTPKWHPVGPPKDKLNIPCHAVVVDPDHSGTVYLGSDVGVWKLTREKILFKWHYEQYSYGLPEAAITDLVIHEKGRLLRCGTHGRGVWEIAPDQKSSPSIDLYLRANLADNGRMDTKTKKRFDWNITGKGVPDPSAPGKYLSDAFSSPDIQVAAVSPHSSPIAKVIVHNRGWRPIDNKKVRVCLLMADVSGVVSIIPKLPKDFGAHINKGDKNWVDGSDWKFADPSQPYANPLSDLRAYDSEEVLFSPDYSQLNLVSLGLHSVCFAAFVTTTDATDPLSGTNTDLDLLVMSDNHVAYKKVFVP